MNKGRTFSCSCRYTGIEKDQWRINDDSIDMRTWRQVGSDTQINDTGIGERGCVHHTSAMRLSQCVANDWFPVSCVFSISVYWGCSGPWVTRRMTTSRSAPWAPSSSAGWRAPPSSSGSPSQAACGHTPRCVTIMTSLMTNYCHIVRIMTTSRYWTRTPGAAWPGWAWLGWVAWCLVWCWPGPVWANRSPAQSTDTGSRCDNVLTPASTQCLCFCEMMSSNKRYSHYIILYHSW